MPLALRYVAHCEIGLVRKNNQDSAYISPTMLVVADGMGGAAAGDLASAVAVRELKAADGPRVGAEMLEALNTAVEKAGEAIADLIETDPRLDGMGSTVCGFMFDGTQVGLVNIGDSRAYRFRDGRLSRLTRDHSWVQTLVDSGRITEAEALEHPHRSLILKVINGTAAHLPDLELSDAALGDRFLVCSDGLCGMVTDEIIEAHMDGEREDVLEALTRVAYNEGGQDNITIIVADVVEDEPSDLVQVLGAAATLDPDAPFEHTIGMPRGAATPRPDPAAAEHARYAPVVKHRLATWAKITVTLLVALLLLAGAGFGWYSYTQRQYYLGPSNNYVAIFQGIADPVFNLPLSHVLETSDTQVVDLPPYYQEQVRQTIRTDSLDVARRTLDTLKLKAADCIRQRQQTHPTTTPSATSGLPTTSAKASPTATAQHSPDPATALYTPTPSPTPTTPTVC